MEGKFTNFVLENLRDLISEIENAQEPSNGALREAITAELRLQYDRANKRPGYLQYTDYRP